MRNFIENVNIKEHLSFTIPVDCHFYCDPINFKKGEIIFGNTSTGWITRDILFKFKNSRIQLYGCNTRNLNANDFDRFVDRWYRSDDTEFELLTINWKQYPGSPNISKFKPFAWNENRRSQNFRLVFLNFSHVKTQN